MKTIIVGLIIAGTLTGCNAVVLSHYMTPEVMDMAEKQCKDRGGLRYVAASMPLGVGDVQFSAYCKDNAIISARVKLKEVTNK